VVDVVAEVEEVEEEVEEEARGTMFWGTMFWGTMFWGGVWRALVEESLSTPAIPGVPEVPGVPRVPPAFFVDVEEEKLEERDS